jgi:hypothetical protein
MNRDDQVMHIVDIKKIVVNSVSKMIVNKWFDAAIKTEALAKQTQHFYCTPISFVGK